MVACAEQMGRQNLYCGLLIRPCSNYVFEKWCNAVASGALMMNGYRWHHLGLDLDNLGHWAVVSSGELDY